MNIESKTIEFINSFSKYVTSKDFELSNNSFQQTKDEEIDVSYNSINGALEHGSTKISCSDTSIGQESFNENNIKIKGAEDERDYLASSPIFLRDSNETKMLTALYNTSERSHDNMNTLHLNLNEFNYDIPDKHKKKKTVKSGEHSKVHLNNDFYTAAQDGELIESTDMHSVSSNDDRKFEISTEGDSSVKPECAFYSVESDFQDFENFLFTVTSEDKYLPGSKDDTLKKRNYSKCATESISLDTRGHIEKQTYFHNNIYDNFKVVNNQVNNIIGGIPVEYKKKKTKGCNVTTNSLGQNSQSGVTTRTLENNHSINFHGYNSLPISDDSVKQECHLNGLIVSDSCSELSFKTTKKKNRKIHKYNVENSGDTSKHLQETLEQNVNKNTMKKYINNMVNLEYKLENNVKPGTRSPLDQNVKCVNLQIDAEDQILAKLAEKHSDDQTTNKKKKKCCTDPSVNLCSGTLVQQSKNTRKNEALNIFGDDNEHNGIDSELKYVQFAGGILHPSNELRYKKKKRREFDCQNEYIVNRGEQMSEGIEEHVKKKKKRHKKSETLNILGDLPLILKENELIVADDKLKSQEFEEKAPNELLQLGNRFPNKMKKEKNVEYSHEYVLNIDTKKPIEDVLKKKKKKQSLKIDKTNSCVENIISVNEHSEEIIQDFTKKKRKKHNEFGDIDKEKRLKSNSKEDLSIESAGIKKRKRRHNKDLDKFRLEVDTDIVLGDVVEEFVLKKKKRRCNFELETDKKVLIDKSKNKRSENSIENYLIKHENEEAKEAIEEYVLKNKRKKQRSKSDSSPSPQFEKNNGRDQNIINIDEHSVEIIEHFAKRKRKKSESGPANQGKLLKSNGKDKLSTELAAIKKRKGKRKKDTDEVKLKVNASLEDVVEDTVIKKNEEKCNVELDTGKKTSTIKKSKNTPSENSLEENLMKNKDEETDGAKEEYILKKKKKRHKNKSDFSTSSNIEKRDEYNENTVNLHEHSIEIVQEDFIKKNRKKSKNSDIDEGKLLNSNRNEEFSTQSSDIKKKKIKQMKDTHKVKLKVDTDTYLNDVVEETVKKKKKRKCNVELETRKKSKNKHSTENSMEEKLIKNKENEVQDIKSKSGDADENTLHGSNTNEELLVESNGIKKKKRKHIKDIDEVNLDLDAGQKINKSRNRHTENSVEQELIKKKENEITGRKHKGGDADLGKLRKSSSNEELLGGIKEKKRKHKKDRDEVILGLDTDKCSEDVLEKIILKKKKRLHNNEKENKEKSKCDNEDSRDLELNSFNVRLTNEDRTSPDSDQYENLRKIDIRIPFEIPKLHTFETQLGRVVKDQRRKIDESGLPLKTGPFSLKEDKIIKENFSNFCKLHEVQEDPRLFGVEGKFGILRGNRIRFAQFLAHGLEDRILYSVMNRFKRLYATKIHGRFTSAEDCVILNYMNHNKSATPYKDLSKILNRDRIGILKRHKYLISENATKNVVWSMEYIRKFLRRLKRVTQCTDINELKNRPITDEEFRKLSEKMNIPNRKLRRAWFVTIYPRLFAKNLNLHVVKHKLVEILYRKKYNDWRTIKWHKITKKFEGFTSEKLQSLLNSMVMFHVKKSKRKDLRGCLEILKNVVQNKQCRKYKLKPIDIHKSNEVNECR